LPSNRNSQDSGRREAVWAAEQNGRIAVATYVVLVDWTDQGVKGFKDSVDRLEAAQNQLLSMGVSFDTYWTLGAHDMVSIVEAPDDQALAAALLSAAGLGNIRTTTLRAFRGEEMRSVIAKAG
jgi:uncharacterized protein with GYD domain